MDLKIKGKKAIMAGGSAGMGRATAERLAEAGVDLYITARREERLKKAAAEISEKYGTTVTPVVADSSTEEGRNALFAACPDPDILAITIKPPAPNGDFLKVTPDMWRSSIETTLNTCGATRSNARSRDFSVSTAMVIVEILLPSVAPSATVPAW